MVPHSDLRSRLPSHTGASPRLEPADPPTETGGQVSLQGWAWEGGDADHRKHLTAELPVTYDILLPQWRPEVAVSDPSGVRVTDSVSHPTGVLDTEV